jgi:hypothetical protein
MAWLADGVDALVGHHSAGAAAWPQPPLSGAAANSIFAKDAARLPAGKKALQTAAKPHDFVMVVHAAFCN